MAEQVKSVAAGKTESVMLKNDKTVWQWGDVIGHRNDPDAPKISPILKDSGYVFVTAGYTHFLGIKSDKSVWAWGSNGTCQLGNGGSCMSTEIPVKIADGFVSVAAGQFHSVGIKENGELWGWGDNEDGQLGVGPAIVRTPVKMGDGFASVEAGSIYTLARKTNGDVVGFGRSFSSDCQPLVRCAPALLGADFSAMAAGQSHFLLLKSDGSVYARGQNYNGQLGDGTEVQRRSLALVVNATLDGFLNLNSQSPAEVPAEYRVPFFLAASGDLTQSIPSLNARIRFKPSDIGQQGAVFVTARVPKGTLPLSTSGTAGTVAAASASAASARNPRESEVEELLQLTWEGWLIVSDGELFPLVTGVFGELLDTLAILEAYDPNNSGGSARDSTVRSKLAGSKFCVGYGSSASAMTSAGQMRMVANVDDLSAATSSSASCVLTAATNGLTVPGVPRKVDVIAGDSSAVISFTEPVSNGGAPITGYMATCTGGGHTAQASGSSAPLTVANLTNGISYSCSVSATNSAGSGPVTKPVTVTATSTISILPAAPTAVTATEGDRSVSVNFLPAELGTGALLNYSAACTSNRSDYIFGEGAFSPVSVFPLVNGQAYVCAVKAISTAGSSAWSAESTPVIPVDLPDLLVSELTSASSVRAGGGLLVSASVTNRGRGDAVASRVEFRLLENVADQNSPLAGISNNYCDIPPVRPGQTSRCETTLGVPTSAVLGTRYLVAIADSDQQVTESNEANNSRTASAPIVISKAVRRSITPMIMLLLSSLHQAGEATSAQADPWGLLSAGRPVITGHEEYLRRLLGSGAQITASEVEN
jgi:hypothetical protein